MPSQARAGAPAPLSFDWSAPAGQTARADWSAYAKAYDMLSEYNPAYQALLQDFETFLGTIETPRVIYDVGGGTGNYTEVAARVCPRQRDPCRGTRRRHDGLGAGQNCQPMEMSTYFNRALEDVDASGTADLVICVHALYAMPRQEERLGDLRRLLRPGGWLYLIDLGRYMNVAEWRSYLFSHLKREHGLAGALRIFWQGREIGKQNKSILHAQVSGVYWTHTEAENRIFRHRGRLQDPQAGLRLSWLQRPTGVSRNEARMKQRRRRTWWV